MKNTKKILNTLSGESVRITVETNDLNQGTLTYECFSSLDDILNNNIIKGQVMFFDGVNMMGKTHQKLIDIIKIETYNHEWIEVFNKDGVEG